MGVIFKNENITEDMIEIFKKFQLYEPTVRKWSKEACQSIMCWGSIDCQSTQFILSAMVTHQRTDWKASPRKLVTGILERRYLR